MADPSFTEARAAMEAAGYVVLKAESYRRAQERQRVAQVLKEYADQDAERTRAWAHETFDEQRRLRDRLTFVYGVAMAHGATRDELAGSTGFDPPAVPDSRTRTDTEELL